MKDTLLPYLNRPYVEGVFDCYTAVQAFYLGEYGLRLRSYARPSQWALTPGLDFFTEHFQREGFVDLNQSCHRVMYGDALLMRINRSEKVNHVAVYVGRNKILQHFEGSVSRLDDYSDKWRYRVTSVLRHPETKMANSADTLAKYQSKLPAHLKRRVMGG